MDTINVQVNNIDSEKLESSITVDLSPDECSAISDIQESIFGDDVEIVSLNGTIKSDFSEIVKCHACELKVGRTSMSLHIMDASGSEWASGKFEK